MSFRPSGHYREKQQLLSAGMHSPPRQRSVLYIVGLFAAIVFLYRCGLLLPPAVRQDFRPRPPAYDWAARQDRHPVLNFVGKPGPSKKALPQIQHAFAPETKEHAKTRRVRQAKVKAALKRTYKAYHHHAWMQDVLQPITGTGRNESGGWAMTLVETLDTLWIMDMRSEFIDAVNAVAQIDFSVTRANEINVFGVNSRILGGLLGAYDLSGDRRLLEKALDVANMLYAAFDTPNRMPDTHWSIRNTRKGESHEAGESVMVAEIGSLALEFTRLTQLTGNPKWYDAVAKIMDVFDAQQNSTMLPGMWPVVVNPRQKVFDAASVFSLGSQSDALYATLPKMYMLLGGSDLYRKMYHDSMTTALEHALFRPMVPQEGLDILMAGPVHVSDGKASVEQQGQHHACHAGGMLALGGRLMEDRHHVEVGKKLVHGCIWAHEASPLGIMPEYFTVVDCPDANACVWSEERYFAEVVRRYSEKKPKEGENPVLDDPHAIIQQERLSPGFTSIIDRWFHLRPNTIESMFTLYRITGERVLQDQAWNLFETINKYSKTEFANAALSDVTLDPPPQGDMMESFWLAATLKYFYLMFSEPGFVNLNNFVFNTAGHPLRCSHES